MRGVSREQGLLVAGSAASRVLRARGRLRAGSCVQGASRVAGFWGSLYPILAWKRGKILRPDGRLKLARPFRPFARALARF